MGNDPILQFIKNKQRLDNVDFLFRGPVNF